MTSPRDHLVSDADRDRAVASLREHVADGRLTLEEFSERASAALAARTSGELEQLAADLPPPPAPTARRRRPTRLLFSLFGSTEHAGRMRARRRIFCVSGFGNIDLDLREATLEGDVVTVYALGAFCAIDVYVPGGVEVDLHGFTLFGHRRENGAELPHEPAAPLVRVIVIAAFAGIDVWRVPAAWATLSWSEIIRAMRKGRHRELRA